MADDEEILRHYEAAWQHLDATAIRDELEGCWAPGGTYTDPVTDEAVGADALVRVIQQFHDVFPGVRIAPTSQMDRHHDRGRFSWEMRQDDGTVLLEGIDFVDFADDGRFARISGFFGPLPTG